MSEYKDVCDWLDDFWSSQNMFFCWGCGAGGRIEHHHMISRQEAAKIGKPELLTDKKNIIPLCYNCHHNKWHDGGIEDKKSLLCFDFIMDFYLENHPQLHELLTIKIEEYATKKNNG